MLRVLLVASVYLFLLWVALAVRRGADVRASPVRGNPSRLVVVAAPPGGPEPGLALALQPRMTIGRAAENLLVVADPIVSARHAALVQRGDSWIVEDLGSTNGTMVNDQWVRAPVAIGVGDEISIGPARFRLEA